MEGRDSLELWPTFEIVISGEFTIEILIHRIDQKGGEVRKEGVAGCLDKGEMELLITVKIRIKVPLPRKRIHSCSDCLEPFDILCRPLSGSE